MSSVRSSRDRGEGSAVAFDADLAFLRRFAGPVVLLSRAMMAYIFVVEGVGKITGYAGVAAYMQEHGVAPAAPAAGHPDRAGRRASGSRRLQDALGGDRARRLLPLDGDRLPSRRGRDDRVAEERRHGGRIPRSWPCSAPAPGRSTGGLDAPNEEAAREGRVETAAPRPRRAARLGRACRAGAVSIGRPRPDCLARPHGRRAGQFARRPRQLCLARLHRA